MATKQDGYRVAAAALVGEIKRVLPGANVGMGLLNFARMFRACEVLGKGCPWVCTHPLLLAELGELERDKDILAHAKELERVKPTDIKAAAAALRKARLAR